MACSVLVWTESPLKWPPEPCDDYCCCRPTSALLDHIHIVQGIVVPLIMSLKRKARGEQYKLLMHLSNRTYALIDMSPFHSFRTCIRLFFFYFCPSLCVILWKQSTADTAKLSFFTHCCNLLNTCLLVQAIYLPWVLLAFNMIISGGWVDQFMPFLHLIRPPISSWAFWACESG